MNILEAKGIVKRFGDFTAVDGISFSIEAGRVHGLLGPNGAGKTTTIRMLTSILLPDNGTIRIFGDGYGSSTQNRIGYLPEERGLYKKIKVIEQLAYFGQLKGLTRSQAMTKGRYWLQKMDAADWENKKIQELSKGMQQKVQFIATILHEPDLLILDEPFSGFDPINTELMKKIILDLKDEGKTVILSTHIMEQAEQLCDDINLINRGKIVLAGKIRDIKAGYGRDTIIVEFDGDDSFMDDFRNLKIVNKTKNRIEFRLTESSLPKREILQSMINKVDIHRFEVAEPSLNEIFIDVVSKQESSNG